MCKDAGLSFGYHNHNYEFEKVEGQVMYDYMLEHTNPEYVFFQMDMYWTVRGASSPVEYFKRYRLTPLARHKSEDRSRYCHLW